ncbi:MAG: recombinase family protein [Clostridium sp.]|nr:recombinase family protein [Clostridium sp.]
MRYTALYGRQSLDVRDSLSVPMQIEKARAECGEDEVCKQYVDKGFSGKNTKRPGFLQLMQDIEDDLISRVIVYKLDRFSRSILDFSEAWAVMERHQVEFLSVNEKFDTSTPMGKAMLFILMVFAQMERETISERVTDNYYERAKYGGWLGGPAPFGMALHRLQDESGKMVPSLRYTEQFEHLRMIFSEYAQSPFLSLGQLAKKLRDKEVLSPGGGAWNNVTLSRLLRNPVYVIADAEIYRYYKMQGVKILQELQDFDGTHAGMLISKRSSKDRQRRSMENWTFTLANWEGRIPSDIWLECQAKLVRNRQLGRSGAGSHSWLSGLAKCAYCGHSLTVTSYGQQRYFHCAGRRDGICPKKPETLYVDGIERIVEQEILSVMERCLDDPFVMEPEQHVENRQELVKIEEEIENLVSFIGSGKAVGTTVKYINDRLAELSVKQAKIREEELNAKKGKKIRLQNIDFVALDLEHKKEVAGAYLQKVLVCDQKSVEIVWNI